MLMNVAYKHTFGYDTFECSSVEEATALAVKSLQQEFKTTSNSIFPLRGESFGKPFVVYKWEDLIEEIWEDSPEDDEDE